MALTESNMMPLGTKAPDFLLPDTITGQMVSLDDGQSYPATLIMFICNHCPFVLHVNQGIIDLANDLMTQGVRVMAISSNDANTYPQDGPDEMKKHALHVGYPFPYLYDESQEVAKAYDAACTPDFYLFDERMHLYYRGRLDGSRPGNDIPVTGEDLRAAVQSLLSADPAPEPQLPSAGCNIKWK